MRGSGSCCVCTSSSLVWAVGVSCTCFALTALLRTSKMSMQVPTSKQSCDIPSSHHRSPSSFVTSRAAFRQKTNKYQVAGSCPAPAHRVSVLVFHGSHESPATNTWNGLLEIIKSGRKYTNFPLKPSLLSLSSTSSQSLPVNMESL